MRHLSVRAAIACAVAALTLACAPVALSAPLPGSSYDSGDGNQDNALGLDWQGAYGAGAVQEARDANDDCFVGGVKELTPSAWAFNTSARRLHARQVQRARRARRRRVDAVDDGTDGDVRLSFEVGGSSLTTSLYKWVGDGSGRPPARTAPTARSSARARSRPAASRAR